MLLSELKEGNTFSYGLFDQENFETIDRLWLEQRLYEIDDDSDRDPITLKTQLLDHLRSVYDCTGLTKPLAAIFLIGEFGLINKVVNTPPFHASPRVPKPNEFFRADRQLLGGKSGSGYVRKFLGLLISIRITSRLKLRRCLYYHQLRDLRLNEILRLIQEWIIM